MTPVRPVDPLLPVKPGWDDERLAAAFAARAAHAAIPPGLIETTLGGLRRPAAKTTPWWRRMAPIGAAGAVLVAAVGGGLALLGGPGGLLGSGGGLTFRDGPSPGLRTLDTGSYAIDFPAEWLAYPTTSVAGSGGSIVAILTTQPVEERCGGPTGVDVNCVYEQSLEPGAMRIVVGTGSYRGQTIFDRGDIENGTTIRLGLGGMPALVDEFDDVPGDYYQADHSATWEIATPTSLSTVVRLEFIAREPGGQAARELARTVAASIRFMPPPTPLPDDPAAVTVAARAALEAEAASFRQGFVPAGDTDAHTYLDCLAPVPGEDRVIDVRYGPGGARGRSVSTRCRWFVTPVRGYPFWHLATVYEWRTGDEVGWYGDRYYIDAAAVVVARSSTGEVPPAGDPSATPTPAPTPAPTPTAPTWGPWPPADALSVLEFKDGISYKPMVAIVDESGLLTRAEATIVGSEGADGFSRDPSSERRYRLRWGTTICDREMTVTIDADLTGIVIRHAPRGGCDAMGIGRELILEFSRDVDPADVTLQVIRAEILPEAVSPGVPKKLFGLDVVDVDEALAIQARPGDDREIGVRGWLWLNRAVARCRISPETWMFGRDCGLWDTLRASADGGPEIPVFFGPAVAGNPTAEESGLEIVMVGHFDDRRSSACGATFAPRCADTFYVDSMWMTGAPVPRDWIVPPADPDLPEPPLGKADAAAAAAQTVFDDDPTRTMPHDSWVLSVGLLSGDQVDELEPSLPGACGPGCDALFQTPTWVWHVTALDRTTGVVRTFVIDDTEFGDESPIIMREPTIDAVLEYETTIATAPEGIVIHGLLPGVPITTENDVLPRQVP